MVSLNPAQFAFTNSIVMFKATKLELAPAILDNLVASQTDGNNLNKENLVEDWREVYTERDKKSRYLNVQLVSTVL